MKNQSCFLLLAFLFLSPSMGQDKPQTYLLASKKPPLPVGETFELTSKFSFNEVPFALTVEEQKFEGKMTRAERKVTRYEFLAQDRVQVTYLVDLETGKQSLMGQTSDINERRPTEGRVFLLVQKAGKWAVDPKPEGVEPADQEVIDEAIESLEKEANDEIEESLKMYGDQPRKVGETWEVDALALPGMDNLEILGGKVTLTLKAIEKFNGEECAILGAKFKLAGQMTDEPMKGVAADMSGTLEITRSLKYFEDYKMTGRIGMKSLGEMQLQPGITGTFKMEGDARLEMTAVKQPTKEKE